MQYTLQHIAEIIGAETIPVSARPVVHLLTDSRRLVFPDTSLFFAIGGPRRDGHWFIPDLYERGVRAFVVERGWSAPGTEDAVFLEVPDVLRALQQLAAFHRRHFNIPVIGITGSNGKTMVKEWLYRLLYQDQVICRSPRSYNSQIGVPLSVWQLKEEDTLGIFEAGISTRNEMEHIAGIIQPTLGIFTNIAEAHREGFDNDRQKAVEKAKLFSNVKQLVFCREALAPALYPDGTDAGYFPPDTRFFSWSRITEATLFIVQEQHVGQTTLLKALYEGQTLLLKLPFTARIAIDNAITCWCVMLLDGYPMDTIQQRMLELEPVDMRMQLKKGRNNCYILNDSYSNDTASLLLALDYLKQQSGNNPATVILSDILESGQPPGQLYHTVLMELLHRGISKIIGIGPAISHYLAAAGKDVLPGKEILYFPSTEVFLEQAAALQFRDEYILLKGARVFAFERIGNWLEQQVHQTVMEIDLTAMAHNLKIYQSVLHPDTKLMAMVKAFSYGSGSAEVARVLQFQKVDYLAVAYADEGVELRKAGISLPVMVMNADEATFESLVTYHLEPEIYSFGILEAFHAYLGQQGITQFPVHIKFNTGMNRLGFEPEEAKMLANLLQQQNAMVVRSAFSHLVSSELSDHDGFTAHQATIFNEACDQLEKILNYPFLRHIANTAAIFRHPRYQLDMVRLGIGLYGVDSTTGDQLPLQVVATLQTTIAQLRKVKAGKSVGYNRKGILQRDSLIATVRIGYADGYRRTLGNGVGKMYLRGCLAPVVGNVCMDMTMLDVTDIPGVAEGDLVEVFGSNLPVQDVAAWSGTIAYEVMTGIGHRVKRIYIQA
ncbi:bifunctional UDP-N-acetylmuramoyl-tripeptide:D-alanyl-D-alanine ligase/alanine racemase [Sediminibacterium ginsengisoli]|uniref:Alanine racemase n=1 Tax=Sediminibacterium ginsengisoli TaxID=413434 RepID=A0A1T4K543_9BACT|nr:bifunctional UDP-N-acetylmuramoyl-tripeptide:D-alanyl-D-alanine ligase/alanine racemase [Sediminibacterium ginsengisoli]SJZ37435.1 UDP-N-acetylmuramoyl-tripeptide--D-alanyl-D-alanine ligase [Sediminibacterium ginsengisoli]